jgi:TolB-like protein
VLARHSIDPVPPLSTVRPGAPLPVERAVAKALSKVPADRYSTVAQFGEALTAPTFIPETVPRPRRALAPALRPRLLAAATAATGLMLLAIIRSSGDGASRPPGVAVMKTLAIQPFSNLTGDTSQIYLAQGLTDQLVTSLAQIGTLRVISLKDTKKATGQLVKESGLDAVLAGSLLRSGNAVRVTVQLNSAATNQALWAQGYDGELSGILDLQAEVARSVASRSARR